MFKLNSSWNDSYALDIKMIDEQHKKFFMLFDEIQIAQRNGESHEVISEYIQELENYVNYHFRIEETLMKHGNHPDMEFHLSQHNIFRRKVADFKLASEYENMVILDQMVIFMRKWFLTHIFNDDSKYVPYVQHYFHEKEEKKNKNKQ
jgi:hemerythrin